MKIRYGFVSNSSSSSFIINKSDITEKQLYQIKNHIGVSNQLKKKSGCKNMFQFNDPGEAWDLHETETTISGWTTMDNFQMTELFEAIGVSMDMYKISEYNTYFTGFEDDPE
jgi:hypothetical protein